MLPFLTGCYRFDIIVITLKLLVFILVDMDRGDQDLYTFTKYSIIEPLSKKIYGNPRKICYKKKKQQQQQKQNKTKQKQTNKTAWS